MNKNIVRISPIIINLLAFGYATITGEWLFAVGISFLVLALYSMGTFGVR